MPKRSLKSSPPASSAPRAATATPTGGQTPRVAIVVSRYNWTITGKLLEGAQASFAAATGSVFDQSNIFHAPGAFELVAVAHAAAESRAFDGVVTLGCIIKGETSHDEVLGHAVTQGLANISLVTGIPVTLGVLTVNTPKQAKARAGGKHGNKGTEAMDALLATMAEIQRIDARRSGSKPKSFEIDLSSLTAAPDKLTSKGDR